MWSHAVEEDGEGYADLGLDKWSGCCIALLIFVLILLLILVLVL